MLFLYRPPQTWMPYSLPRNRTEQGEYNRQLQWQFASSRRVAAPVPSVEPADPDEQIRSLDELRASGVLTTAEYEAAVARVRS